jgi:release factor glutamine methyltransferase
VTTVDAALREGAARLEEAGVDAPRVDAEILLAHVLGTTRSGVRADGRRELDRSARTQLEQLLVRREAREPLAYVLGEWGFRRLTLKVDRRVLVPRPETEIVVERCLALLAGHERSRVLDVGTGSGAIALAIADEHLEAEVTGMDASAEALEVARENAARTGLEVELVEGDLFAGLPAGPWDLVVSNPPYVLPADIDSLEPEVRQWEPRTALVADGATEAIAEAARGALRPGGALVLEVADGTAAHMAGLMHDLGYSGVEITRDLAGRDRVVEGVTTSAD